MTFNAAPHELRLLPSLTASPTLTLPTAAAPTSGVSSSLSLSDSGAGASKTRRAARRGACFFTPQVWANGARMVMKVDGVRRSALAMAGPG